MKASRDGLAKNSEVLAGRAAAAALHFGELPVFFDISSAGRHL
jgi:hypothetical protein